MGNVINVPEPTTVFTKPAAAPAAMTINSLGLTPGWPPWRRFYTNVEFDGSGPGESRSLLDRGPAPDHLAPDLRVSAGKAECRRSPRFVNSTSSVQIRVSAPSDHA